MLLTITTTHRPATDLGYLLHKHPARCQSFDLPWGQAHVFYPEATEARCTAALLLEIDSVGLVRRSRDTGFSLQNYVNDRPYVASSFTSTAIAQVYGSALSGRSKERPALAATPIPLEASVTAVPSPGGVEGLRRLFEPLGYDVAAARPALDPQVPEWGPSTISKLTLRGEVRLADLLSHLYVLLPALDDEKHYYVGQAEVEKLLQRGQNWLAEHPEREFITRRYLVRRRSLVDEALERLTDGDDASDQGDTDEDAEDVVERSLSLSQQRMDAVVQELKASGAVRVLDLGCGEGKLMRRLLREAQFQRVVGVDVSWAALQWAARKLHLDRLPADRRARIELLQGSLTYRDSRLAGYDAAAVVEVVEHIAPERLQAFERTIFEFARPGTVVLTTPNREYNVRFPNLAGGRLRHRDHRFEWPRDAFQSWGRSVGDRFGYQVRFRSIGAIDDQVGSPTQMAVFSLPAEGGRA
jgi:3' terminal RNA ribose 2'-O-methyltransferase Hen1